MLRVADRIDDQDTELLSVETLAPVPAPSFPTSVTLPPPSRYGQGKSPNWLAIAFILIVHALLIAALMHARQQAQRREEARLSVINLTPPAPPPAQEAPPPPPTKPQVVAPAPLVQVAPVLQIATTPIPSPTVASAPSVKAPAPVAVAPPAPPSVVQGGDLSSQMVAGKAPRYPIESRRKREQGTVVLALTLGLDGGVEAITIAHSSGFSRLDDAARDAVRRWRWRPMIQQGQPVKVKGIVEIPFVLQMDAT